MSRHQPQTYAVAIAVGGGVAVWAGMSPWLLLILLVCPVSMYFTMRGMNRTRPAAARRPHGRGHHEAHDRNTHP